MVFIICKPSQHAHIEHSINLKSPNVYLQDNDYELSFSIMKRAKNVVLWNKVHHLNEDEESLLHLSNCYRIPLLSKKYLINE